MSAASSPAASPRRRSRRRTVIWSFLALFLFPVFGAAGVLANYSGLYRHRASRSCTNGALACS